MAVTKKNDKFIEYAKFSDLKKDTIHCIGCKTGGSATVVYYKVPLGE